MTYQSYASNDIIGKKKNLRNAESYMDESEVVTRMMFVLHQFRIYDLNKLDWATPFETQGIDSLETTAFLTSFEHEFHTIFEDNIFDSFENLDQVKKHITNDHNAF